MSHPNEYDIARAATYRFFARFFLSEPDAAWLEALTNAEPFSRFSSSNPHELRIEFTRLFTLNVFPYPSVFLDSEAFLNTETTAHVQAAYEQAEFQPPPGLAVGAPDHYGLELMFVAHLLETGREPLANVFLSEEILPWAVVFLHAVEKNAREDYYRVAAQEVRAWLMNDLASPPIMPRSDSLSSVLTDEDDLDSIVTRLVTPAQSGIFLSKDDISSLARELELPVSFGDRGLALRSLFQAAGEYEHVEDLLQALSELTETWMGYYLQDARTSPGMALISELWMKRAVSTRDQLKELSRIAHQKFIT
ncbi:MAG: molecular chaperone [Acidobacteriota bacterium]